jgi:SulP family sulfate permease
MLEFSFRPKILESLEHYSAKAAWSDLGAGLTVGVVALPLAMAFAIASGLPPQVGLFTSIIAGLMISALGGSKVQIGGPAGAFIVIVYGIVQTNGVQGLIIATLMSGVMLFLMGLLKLGTLIRFIPVAVVIGFTNAIAVLIMLSQIKDFLGLNVEKMPADFLGLIQALSNAVGTLNPSAFGVACASLSFLFLWQLWLPRKMAQYPSRTVLSRLQKIPGSIIVLVGATAFVYLTDLPVQTIGTKFGGIPSVLPTLVWTPLGLGELLALLRPALTLALLGAIESLLCARIADNLVDDRHNPNQELMGQGIANFVGALFGAMPATGTIARTVTNAKNGAVSPVAGVVHCLTLLVIVLIAAPLAFHIPLSALSAILMFVAWNMGEWREFVLLKEFRLPYRLILLTVFFLTILVDLASAVEFGLIGACMTFIYRISSLSRSELFYESQNLKAHRLYGALFFGAVQLIEAIELSLPKKILILDFKNLIYLDTSGTDALLNLLKSCEKRGLRIIFCGLMHQPLGMMQRSGLLDKLSTDCFYPDIATALEQENTENL